MDVEQTTPRFARMFLLGFALLVTFGCAELVVRVFERLASAQVATTNIERPRFFYRPSAALTMRGNVTDQKAVGSYRIAVVGDSFSFAPGMQFDDTFAKRLERMLVMQQPPRSIEVMNYGTPGLSTVNEQNFIDRALAQGADLLLLQITLNDPQLRPLQKEPPEVRGSFGPFTPALEWEWLYRMSHTARFIAERVHNSRSVQSYINYHHQLFTRAETWGPFSEALRSAVAKAKQRQVAVAVVLFPLFDFPLDASYPFAEIHQKVAELAKESGAPVLDLFADYAGLDPKRLVLIPGKDSHPNEIAHRIAAESIYRFLVQQQLLPEQFQMKQLWRSRSNVEERSSDPARLLRLRAVEADAEQRDP